MKTLKKRQPLSKRIGKTAWVHSEGRTFSVNTEKSSSSASRSSSSAGTMASDGILLSPMPGKILKINVVENQKVVTGQTVCVLEAMKMEYSLKAPFDGTAHGIYKKAGDSVILDEKIIEIKKR